METYYQNEIKKLRNLVSQWENHSKDMEAEMEAEKGELRLRIEKLEEEKKKLVREKFEIAEGKIDEETRRVIRDIQKLRGGSRTNNELKVIKAVKIADEDGKPVYGVEIARICDMPDTTVRRIIEKFNRKLFKTKRKDGRRYVKMLKHDKKKQTTTNSQS